MSSLVIVDSGSANLNSIYKAAQMVGLEPTVSDDPRVISGAGAVIFPGVGSFHYAAALIREKQLAPALLEVLAAGKPFLGICLGMQLLFSSSEEDRGGNIERGLGALPGLVKRFPDNLPVPHVGWNRAKPSAPHPLFRGLEEGAYFYFTHSYHVVLENRQHRLAQTDYGFLFASAVAKDNLLGVQFHPEKSGPAGLRLLGNFGKIISDQR